MNTTSSEINTVICPASVQNPRNSEGSILPFPDGRLLLAYTEFHGGSSDDWGLARITGKWSRDQGTTWSEPFVICENYGKVNIMEASLLRLPGGRILLTYNRVDAGGPKLDYQIIHLDLICSDDDGKNWSKPQQISTDDIENMTTNDRLVRLKNGRILLPASGAPNPVWISDDDGRTWRNGRGEYRCAAEPTVVELADGSVLVYSREGSTSPERHLHVAQSEDGGDTWTPMPAMDLTSAAVPCIVQQVPESSDLLIIWNNHHTRTNLTTAVSHDGGRSWENFRLLEPQESWPLTRSHVYPSLTFLNGNAHITYWESHKHPQADYMLHLIYRRLPISWFYEKRPARQVVH